MGLGLGMGFNRCMVRGVNRVRDRDGVRYTVRDRLRYMYIGVGMGLGLVVCVLFFLRNTPLPLVRKKID